MSSCLNRLLVLLVLLHQLEALGCRCNVRDVGFVDLGSEPYRLYLFVGDAMPADEREALQSIAVATYYDTNVKPELVALGQARQTAVKGFIPSGFTGQTPMAVLVSPDQKRTLAVPLAKEGLPILQTAWDALELLVDSPRRNAVLKQVFDCYGVVLIIEGSDATENKRVRSMADAVVSRITAAMPGLEKEIELCARHPGTAPVFESDKGRYACRVADAEEHLAAVVACGGPVEQGGAGGPQVEVPRGARRESGADGHCAAAYRREAGAEVAPWGPT